MHAYPIFLILAVFGLAVRAAPVASEAWQAAVDRTQVVEPTFSNPAVSAYYVNSSALPLVNFTLQDSYAGLLPISNSSTSSNASLFFWYWPSSPLASTSLTIWLNGGPGCSSMQGFLQETGPVRWETGMEAPVANEWSWTLASDMLFVDQPVGTGYSTGGPAVNDEDDVAEQFYGFLQEFYTLFPELLNKTLILAGESYAGTFIPHIATRILNATSAEQSAFPIQLGALLINDGVFTTPTVSQQAPTAAFAAAHQTTLGLSDLQLAELYNRSAQCGYDELLAQVVYPSNGTIQLPAAVLDAGNATQTQLCDVQDLMFGWVVAANPCFNVYRITDTCPQPADPLYTYFNRTDVQLALHVPPSPWVDCSSSIWLSGTDQTATPSASLLPSLISALPQGVTLWHGLLDGLLLSVGDRVMLQNLTWGGGQGFTAEPSAPLVVNGTQVGVWTEERGLTYIEVDAAGHMIPQDQPAVGLQVLKFVLGMSAL